MPAPEQRGRRPPFAFTPGEIRAFRLHALLIAALVAGMAIAVPAGPARVLAVLGAVALLPLPPLVLYLMRCRKR